jgi:DNA-binding MarR family transcriptional regulator
VGWIEVLEGVAASTRLVRHELTRALAVHGVGESQFSILWICQQASSAGISQSDIACRLAISTAHVSGLVEQLRRSGWLDGHRDTADRRRQVWRTTAAGENFVAALVASLAAWLRRAEPNLAQIEAAQLHDLTQRLGQALADDAGAGANGSSIGTATGDALGVFAAPPVGPRRKRGAA